MLIARTALTVGTAVFVAASTIPAAAASETHPGDQPGQSAAGSGTDIMPVGVPQPLSDQAKSKLAAIAAGGEAARGGDAARARSLDNAYAERYGIEPLTPAREMGELSGAPAAKSLSVEHAAQHTGSFCGPASGYMILRFRTGAGYTSRYGGSAPGQDGLANANHLNTAAKKRTDWGDDDFSLGLNRWERSDDSVRVPQPSVQILKDSLVYSIGTHGKPFGVNTVEFEGGEHYNGHPNRTIGHWIVAKGYSGTGASGTYDDPSTSVYGGAKATTVASTQWFQKFAATNGLSL